jgi:hypothetical protein
MNKKHRTPATAGSADGVVAVTEGPEGAAVVLSNGQVGRVFSGFDEESRAALTWAVAQPDGGVRSTVLLTGDAPTVEAAREAIVGGLRRHLESRARSRPRLIAVGLASGVFGLALGALVASVGAASHAPLSGPMGMAGGPSIDPRMIERMREELARAQPGADDHLRKAIQDINEHGAREGDFNRVDAPVELPPAGAAQPQADAPAQPPAAAAGIPTDPAGAQTLLKTLQDLRAKAERNEAITPEMLNKLPPEIAAKLKATGIVEQSAAAAKERAAAAASAPPPIPAEVLASHPRDSFGLNTVPPDLGLSRDGNVHLPLPGGGDIRTPGDMKSFGLNPDVNPSVDKR